MGVLAQLNPTARPSRLALLVLPALVLPVGVLSWTRRRHGSCQLGSEELTFKVPAAGTTIPLPREDVSGYDRREAGIVVHVRGRGLLAALFCPLVIHLGQGDDVGAVLAYLDECGEGQATTSPGATNPRWKDGAALPIVIAASLLVPALVQFTFVPAFKTMFSETGIALPIFSEYVVSGWPPVTLFVATLLFAALWGTWSKGRCVAACWMAIGLYFAITVLGLFLPLLALIEKL